MTDPHGRRLRVVLDTNVVLSGLWGGPPRRVLDLWRTDQMTVVVSQPILDEYAEVINRFDMLEQDIDDLTLLLSDTARTMLVEPRERVHVIREDPTDNKFLEAAVSGDARAVVSGDKHLLRIKAFRSIPILFPSAFLSRRHQLVP